MTQPHYIDRGLLRELFAIVKGECPRLLDEDSGGYATLALRIEDALSRPMEAVAWRYPVLTARDEAVARMARAMRNGKAWPAVFQANTAEALAEDALAALEALAVIPTQGGGQG